MKTTAKNKDTNIRVSRETYKRLKRKAIRYDTTIKGLLEAFSKGDWIKV